MNFAEFNASLSQEFPPADLPALLQALWFDGCGNWEQAHDLAQEIEDRDGSWVHAYLHRKEGDAANAGYWYRRAAKDFPDYSLKEEWETIVRSLLSRDK